MSKYKQTNTSTQARLENVIFINKSMLSFGHQLYQLTKLHHSFIKLLMVRSAVDHVFIALCLIMIYSNAQ